MRKLWRQKLIALPVERARFDVALHTSANARPSRKSTNTRLMGASSMR